MVKFLLPPPLCSIQTLNGLDDAQPLWGEQSTLLSPLIQILMSSKNTLKTHPEIIFNL